MWGSWRYRATLLAGILLASFLLSSPSQAKTVAEVLTVRGGNDLQISRAPGGLKMSSKSAGYLTTHEKFAPPLRIDAVARTDSTNIRLYFGDKGRLIFNWEMGPEELRHHDP